MSCSASSVLASESEPKTRTFRDFVALTPHHIVLVRGTFRGRIDLALPDFGCHMLVRVNISPGLCDVSMKLQAIGIRENSISYY